ncbi:hypothetical protein [Calothrix sp. UHCC 0171]|uniref:hypothetical protein n=1 Tax=Calothrix sp. UHCC 0171 TaxID=3110245 RepID=UPI002B204369|nr:hypothetical protein [Calothrix sp. UHCC 0171]MEA5573500.1 hypothetical protein [Calothrix sp. UHCC 0171]
MAVASAFKLTVLKVWEAEIVSGKPNWKDVVQVRSHTKNLPSGLLQIWADGDRIIQWENLCQK